MIDVSAQPALEAEALAARAARVLPAFAESDVLIVRAQGAYVWNVAGRRFIDHLLSHGATVVGHSDPTIDGAAALAAARCDRICAGLQHDEVELAETIVSWLTSAEKVAFFASGRDALRGAVDVARAATGRSRILFDAGTTGSGLARHGDELAAVVVEPCVHGDKSVALKAPFLASMRESATRRGWLLVFDERKTAFRHDLGGYEAIVGVAPDLTVLGEAMANGHSIAALAGRRELIDSLGLSGCEPRGPHPYAVAAARATLELLASGGVERLHRLGARLREGLQRAIDDARVEASVTGIGSTWKVSWRPGPPVTVAEALAADLDRANAFRAAMLEAGILLPIAPVAASHICVAASADDIDETVDAAAGAFRRVARGNGRAARPTTSATSSAGGARRRRASDRRST